VTAEDSPRRTAAAIGTDIVQISRWHGHARDSTFLRRAFTEAEIALCADRPESLAGRWAAKEATLKALGGGIGHIPLTDIEIGRGTDGRPLLTLHGKARSRSLERGLGRWQVSISHDGDYAVALVLALPDDGA
jgi:holo-[acyl-carrier protein] synthase